MKTSTLPILTAICVAGLLATASAQTTPAQNESTPAQGDETAPPAEDQQLPPQEAAQPVAGDVIVVTTNGAATQGEAPPAEAGQQSGDEQGATSPPQSAITPGNGRSQAQAQGNGRRGNSRRGERAPESAAADGSIVQQQMPDAAVTNGVPSQPLTDGLIMNFRGASIESVLNYLSDAAGFIIQLDTRPSGRVDVWSTHPVTKEEAVDLLNSVLNKNGYAAIRNGRKLTIVSRDDAIHGNVPVITGSDPQSIPNNDEIVTQIIPIRYVEAEQLVKDISPMVSPRATIIANAAGNSLVVTDTQANIRHLAEIIKAIDSSAEDETEVRVFKLQHADPVEMANLLTGLFPDQSGAVQSPINFRGGGGRGGGGRGGGGFGGGPGGGFAAIAAAMGGGGDTGGQNQRIKKRMQVVAVPDQRTASVIVTATKDLMEQISRMVEQLDYRSGKESTAQVFHLNNADPAQVLPMLQDMFTTSASRSTRSSTTQTSPLMSRQQQSQNSSSSTTTTLGGSRTGGGTTQGGTGRQF
jgi:Bacterial type II/III secretion system short domain